VERLENNLSDINSIYSDAKKISKAKLILEKPSRKRTVYLTVIVWAFAIYLISDTDMPTAAKSILWVTTGMVFGSNVS